MKTTIRTIFMFIAVLLFSLMVSYSCGSAYYDMEYAYAYGGKAENEQDQETDEDSFDDLYYSDDEDSQSQYNRNKFSYSNAYSEASADIRNAMRQVRPVSHYSCYSSAPTRTRGADGAL